MAGSSVMPTLLAIDPGIRGCGCSFFLDSTLYACTYVKNPLKEGAGPFESAQVAFAVKKWFEGVHRGASLDRLVLEMPQTYAGRAAKGDANDLFPLAAIDGALAALFSESKVTSTVAHGWKGGVPKGDLDENKIIRDRVETRLSPAERGIFDSMIGSMAKALSHNVIDAVGIGLWGLGRFDRHRVIARE